MQTLTIRTTKKKEIADVTDSVNKALKQGNRQEGLCYLFLLHTTAALTTADLDPGTDLDMLDAFEAIMPKLKYRHPHNPGHVTDHIMSTLIGPSLVVPVQGGRLVLGTWQRVVVVELDGPRERQLTMSFVREAR